MNWRTFAKKIYIYHRYGKQLELRIVKETLSAKCELLLDGGCGDGSFSSNLDFNIIGVDISSEEIRPAKDVLDGVVICDLSNLPIRNQVFKKILSNSVMEHLPRISSAMDEYGRVAKKGAKIVITVPSDRDPWWIQAILGPTFQVRHILSNDEWLKLMRVAGFDKISIKKYQPRIIHYLYIVSCIIPPLIILAPLFLKLIDRIDIDGYAHLCLVGNKKW